MGDVVVRASTIDDARAISTVRIGSWRVAYDRLIDTAVLDGLDVEHETTAREQHWDAHHADPRGGELVAETAGKIVGWAAFGCSQDADLPANGQLYAIYVVPEAWSTGAGHALMLAAEDRLRDAGFTHAHLWVLEGNERAAAFYERHGWIEDGAVKTDDQPIAGRDVGALHERRRVRLLAPKSPPR